MHEYQICTRAGDQIVLLKYQISGLGVSEYLIHPSVAKKTRTLQTSATSYYDSFEGQIDKEGNISAIFSVNALTGKGVPLPLIFTGTIDSLQIKGRFDDYFEMIIEFKKE